VHKTSFAGLTELEPGESIFADGSSFTSRNPSVIDHYLQIGARTHQHNGAVALLDPQTAPGVVLETVGGSLPSNTTLVIGYTLLDDVGGETLVSPTTLVTTRGGIGPPLNGPVTELLNDSGTLTVGTYHYAVTLIDVAGGETPPSPLSDVVRDPGYPNARIRVLGLGDYIADTPGAMRYRLYRGKNSDSLNLIAEGVQDTVIDDGTLECDCCVHPPDVNTNTTGQTSRVTVTVPASAVADAAGWRLYVTDTGELTSPSLFGPTRTLAEADTPIYIDQVLVADGAPPDVATTVDGAAKIDPDTDLLAWHWKRPVATTNDLPIDSNTTEGDTRLVLDDGSLWSFRNGSWAVFTAPAAHWMPPAATAPDLPTLGNTTGDARLVLADFSLWAWDGAAWVKVGGDVAPVSGGHLIADEEDAPLAARDTLTFQGAGVSVTDDLANNRTVVTIPGDPGASGTGPLELGQNLAWVDAKGDTCGWLTTRSESRAGQLYYEDYTTGEGKHWATPYLEVTGTALRADPATAQLDYDYRVPHVATSTIRYFETSVRFVPDGLWTGLGVALYLDANNPSDAVGVELVLDRLAAEAQLRTRISGGAWTVLASWPVSVIPAAGEYVVIVLRREEDDYYSVISTATDALLDEQTPVPVGLQAFDGGPGMFFRMAAHNAWHANEAAADYLYNHYSLIAGVTAGNSVVLAESEPQ
jgi:hypothetical protein